MKTSASKNEILKRELEQLFGEQDANIETAAQCLKVMSHPARLRILCVLRRDLINDLTIFKLLGGKYEMVKI